MMVKARQVYNVKTFVAHILLVIAVSCSAVTFAQERIVGGVPVEQDSLPFMALLWFDDDGDGFGEPFCAGTLIDSSWILGAAHCFYGDNADRARFPERLGVSLGVVDIAGGVDTVAVSSVSVHPDFDASTRAGDIALLQLSSPYAGTPISLPSAASVVPVFDELSVVAGWGRTAEDGTHSAQLLKVELPVRSDLVCNRVFNRQVDTTGAFCAGGEVDIVRDACDGDSGGPLLVQRNGNWVQAGIVNDGVGCARPGVPGVYTRLNRYVDWVVATIDDGFSPAFFDSTQQESGRFPRLNAGEPISGTVQIAQLDVFDVTGLNTVTLESVSGDSDLHILAGDRFENSTVVCESTNETGLDSCEIPESGSGRVYAAVFGFMDNNIYSLNGEINLPTEETTGSSPSTVLMSSGGGGGSVWFSLPLLFILYSGRFARSYM